MSIVTLLAEHPRRPEWSHLDSIADVPVLTVPVRTLQADLVIGCADGAQLGVIALTTAELFHRMRHKELYADLVSLKARWKWAYLLILDHYMPNADGALKQGSTRTGWTFESLQGQLLTVQEMGIGVLTMQHPDQFAATIERLAKRDRGVVRAEPRREALFYTPEELLLLALPGIGETTIDKLLDHCGDVAGALQALTDDSLSMPGIGPKTRETVRKVLGLKPDEFLTKYRPEPEEAAKAA